MKQSLVGAAVLLVGFIILTIPSGAIPSISGTSPPPAEAAAAPEPTSELTPSPVPSADASPPPSETPYELYDPSPVPAPTADPSSDGGTRILAMTIPADDTLDNDTYYNIDAEELLSEEVELSLPKDGYQILIIHTHSTEAYAQNPDDLYEENAAYRTLDPAYSVIRVGSELAAALEQYGLNVLHCTTVFDYPSYNGSYVRSGEAVEEYLAAYPGIGIVIDLHRDAIGEGDTIYKTMANIDGVYAAQLLFVMGSDVNLENPNWRENLKLALTLQTAANARYGSLMRPTNLCAYRYNQQLSPGSLLLEAGTAGNTLDEALCAVRLFAETAGPVLASLVEE